MKRKLAKVTFQLDYEVHLNFQCSYSPAKSKKEAKHTAALNLINHLRNLESFKFDLVFLKVSPNLLEGKKSSTTNQGKRKAVTKTEPEINYIGKLLEYCVKNKLPPASFDFVEQVSKGQNQIEFTMKCSVNNVEKQGMGANKKQAKQRAAMEVLKELSAGDNDVSPNKRMKIEKSEDANTSPEISEDSGIENGGNCRFVFMFFLCTRFTCVFGNSKRNQLRSSFWPWNER